MADAPRVDWRFAALCAAVLDVLFTIQLWISQYPDTPFALAFARQTVTWVVWLGLAPFVIAQFSLAREFSVARQHRQL
jgi:hypothetical protein